MTKVRRWVVGTVTALMLTTTAAAVASTDALGDKNDASAESTGLPEGQSVQETLTGDGLSELRALVAEEIGRDEPQSRVDPATGTYTLFWKGEPSQGLLAIQENPPAGTELIIEQAIFSDDEIQQAVDRLFAAYGTDESVGLNLAGGDGENNGITVGIDPEVIEARGVPQLRHILEEVAQVPVTVVPDGGVEPAARQNDSSESTRNSGTCR